MNWKTTLVLILLLGALGGAFALFNGGKTTPVTPPGTKLFADLLPDAVTRIEIVDWSKEELSHPINLERTGEGWSMSTLAMDEGRPLRARRELVDDLIASFVSATPMGRRDDPGESGLAGLKLDGAGRVEVTLFHGEGQRSVLEIGASVPGSRVLVRRGGSTEILEVHEQLKDDLVVNAERLWDRRLLDLPIFKIRRIVLEKPDETIEVVHEFGQWTLRKPFSGPADRERCEAFRAHLAQAVIQSLGQEGAPWTPGAKGSPTTRIRVEAEGREPVTLRAGQRQGDSMPVVVEGEKRPVLVEASAFDLRHLDGAHFRDRRLVWEKAERIRSIRFERDGKTLWDFRRKQLAFRSHPGNEDGPYILDGVDQQALLGKLLGLRLLNYDRGLGEFPSRITLSVGIGDLGQEASRIRRFEIGAPQEGRCPIRLVGEGGAGWIPVSELAFLDRPAWSWIDHAAGGVGAWWLLGALRVEDAKGAIDFEPVIGKDRVRLRVKKNGKTIELPQSVVDRAVTTLCRIKVQRFADTAPAGAGLETPRLRVFWKLSPKSRPLKGVPAAEETPWRQWEVGTVTGDESCWCRSSERPGLVFEVAHQLPLPFLRLLELSRSQ